MNKKLMVGMAAFLVSSPLFGAEVTAGDWPGSPMGHHGLCHGGMCGKIFSSTNLSTFPAAIKVVRRKADGELAESILPVDSKTTVYHLKSQFVDNGWVDSGYRVELNGKEIMVESVDSKGALITLGQVFEGMIEMPTISLISDLSRSPMVSCTASPAAEEDQTSAAAS